MVWDHEVNSSSLLIPTMSQIHTYPKIFPVGSDFIPDLFKGPVEITEKIDGSQFSFGVTKDKQVVMRSKGKEMFFESHDKMFDKAVDYVATLKESLKINFNDIYFYGEFMGTEKHNIMEYGRIPKNHIMIFGVKIGESWVQSYPNLVLWASKVGLEAVPLMFEGSIGSFEELSKFLEVDSILGKEKVEGIVIKNYTAPCIIGSMILPSFGKYVREDFKERHARDWGSKFSGTNKLQAFIDSFRTEARWYKAIQHLKEKGELVNEPKDIGILMKEISRDIMDEESENIKKELFNLFKEQIIKFAYDKVGVGDSVKNDLKKEGTLSEHQIEALTYSLPNKSEVYYTLKHLFEQRKIIVPNNPKLKEQIRGLYFEKPEGSNYIKIHH